MLNIFPSRENFIENVKKGRISPVYAELPFISPRQAYESIKGPYSFLFESIKGPEKIARYSFAGTDPFLVFKVKNGSVETEFRGKRVVTRNPAVSTSGTPLKKLKEMLGQYKIGVTSGANGFPGNFPPFVGGAVGMFSYDFVHYFERLPRTTTDDLRIPDAHFLLVDTVAAFDHKSKKTFIISCSAAEETGFSFGPVDRDPGTYYESACDKINSLYKKISSKNNADLKSSGKPEKRIRIQHATGENDYIEMVKRAKDYIKAGDIFQANLSQRVSADISRTGPWDIYKTLSRINPSPFAVYLDMGDYQIVSSSPERLVKFSGNTVETRPIAGTRPRGRNAKADRKMRADLLINEKERAEHLMLIDLERNDLGKISDYGSVTVDELMITEDYSHVIHIVSNIKGTAAKGKDCFDAIRATFPGGTITGVPKVRCMEIIDELETVTRGPYTGSLGYISLTGSMDMNIIIRTFVIKNGIAYVQAGAGIVADSDPKKEYGETLKKAEALIKTLEML